jgi:hypothetical protein
VQTQYQAHLGTVESQATVAMCSELLEDVHAAWFRCIDGPIASMFSCGSTQGTQPFPQRARPLHVSWKQQQQQQQQ